MMLVDLRQKRKLERQARDARRGRHGKGVFDALVRQLAGTIRLAFEAGATATLFGLEGPLRHGIRSDLCLQGWRWRDADAMARELLDMAFMVVRATRPSWNEGQPEWTTPANTLIKRTRCVRCHGPLPEEHFKFRRDLCRINHHDRLARLRQAGEDLAVVMAIRTIRPTVAAFAAGRCQRKPNRSGRCVRPSAGSAMQTFSATPGSATACARPERAALAPFVVIPCRTR